MFDLITIGDTTLDVFLELDEASLSCGVDKEACLLCLNYADKIPVKEVTEINGVGNAANVAVGASRLGLKTAIYTVVGDDSLGKNIRKHFKEEKVAVDYLEFDKKNATNYSTVLVYNGERTILVHHESRKYKLPKFKPTKWIYFSSVAADHGSINVGIKKLIKENKHIKMGFNPGTYQLKHGIDKLGSIMKHTSVFIVNKEEAKFLVGDIEDIKELLRQLHGRGPEIVVITDAERGSYAFDGQEYYYQKTIKTKMRERTGAGDSYACGFICALIKGHTIPTAMKWGTLNAISVVQYIGAQKGLLNQSQMNRAIKNDGRLKAVKLNH